MAERPKCHHCGIRLITRPRGLCFRCYYTPEVRDRFGIDPKANRPPEGRENETLEDLDRLIEMRLPSMPKDRCEIPPRDPLSGMERRRIVALRYARR